MKKILKIFLEIIERKYVHNMMGVFPKKHLNNKPIISKRCGMCGIKSKGIDDIINIVHKSKRK